MSSPEDSARDVSDEQKIEKIYRFAAEMMRGGTSIPGIRKELQSRGLDAESSKIVLDDLCYLRDNARREESQKMITQGVFWLFGGAAVTVVTYSSPSSSGTYVVAWAAIGFGALQLFRGLTHNRAA
jgi:hypothetical protein